MLKQWGLWVMGNLFCQAFVNWIDRALHLLLIQIRQRRHLEAELLESTANSLVSFTGLPSRPAYSYSELLITRTYIAPVLALEVAGRIARSCDQASGTRSTLTRMHHGSSLAITRVPVIRDVALKSLLNFVYNFPSRHYGVGVHWSATCLLIGGNVNDNIQ